VSTRIALDTSVLVAAFQPWHDEHGRARHALDRCLGTETPLIPSHALLETYSVLTRMPGSWRMAPGDAFDLIDRTLRDAAEIVSLGPGTLDLLASLSADGVAGGAVYDAEIAATAMRAGAGRLLTLNARHFRRLAPEGLEVIEP